MAIDLAQQRTTRIAVTSIFAAVFETCAYDALVDGHFAASLTEPVLAQPIVDDGQFDLLQLIAEIIGFFVELAPANYNGVMTGKVACIALRKANWPRELVPVYVGLEF